MSVIAGAERFPRVPSRERSLLHSPSHQATVPNSCRCDPTSRTDLNLIISNGCAGQRMGKYGEVVGVYINCLPGSKKRHLSSRPYISARQATSSLCPHGSVPVALGRTKSGEPARNWPLETLRPEHDMEEEIDWLLCFTGWDPADNACPTKEDDCKKDHKSFFHLWTYLFLML